MKSILSSTELGGRIAAEAGRNEDLRRIAAWRACGRCAVRVLSGLARRFTAQRSSAFPRPGLAASVALHVLLLCLVFFSAHVPSPQAVGPARKGSGGVVLQVDLAALLGAAARRGAAVTAATLPRQGSRRGRAAGLKGHPALPAAKSAAVVPKASASAAASSASVPAVPAARRIATAGGGPAAGTTGSGGASSAGVGAGGSGSGAGSSEGRVAGRGSGIGRGGAGSGTGAPDCLPQLLAKVKPVYPDSARRRRQTGCVTLKFLVDDKGRVRQASVVSASPPGVFEKSALAAVGRWRFSPARRRGRPVSAWFLLPVRFTLEDP